jgi:hypothetical protein
MFKSVPRSKHIQSVPRSKHIQSVPRSKRIQSVPHSKPSVCVIRPNRLMLHREIIAVRSQIHTNTLCGQNVELLNVKLALHKLTTGIQSVKLLTRNDRREVQKKERK